MQMNLHLELHRQNYNPALYGGAVSRITERYQPNIAVGIMHLNLKDRVVLNNRATVKTVRVADTTEIPPPYWCRLMFAKYW
jgi:hypothetical protein